MLGPAADGGYWSVGLNQPRDEAFLAVPMSEATTGAAQRERFRALGMRVQEQVTLRDVDRVDDAYAVAREAPRSRFAAALAGLS